MTANLSFSCMCQRFPSARTKEKTSSCSVLLYDARYVLLPFSQTYQKFVEQLLQRHLLFRNTLQERLSAEHWKSLVGDILVQLIGQNDVSGFI